MEPLLEPILWCIVQVTVVAGLAWLLCLAAGRWSAPATTILPAVALAAVVVLTACAFAPWPSWLRYGPRLPATEPVALTPSAGPAEPAGPTEPIATFHETDTQQDTSPIQEHPSIEQPFEVAAEPPSPDIPAAQPPPSPAPLATQLAWWFPLAAAVLVACGAMLGVVQLVAGLFSVGAYRRASRLLHDKDLHELVDCLRAELSLTRGVELRESERLATAATVGWARPAILLPKSWRTWSDDQRRAVLAHELAHVARGDYVACVLAQLSLSLHFYHPLVHWLAARLRLEQELAADAAAAELAGGRRTYLQSLAELSLHTTERPLGWPAHTFLPTQGTFLRRIEMLRDSTRTVPTSRQPAKLRSAPRWAAAGLLVLAALLVAGLRGPSAGPFADAALAQAPATSLQPSVKGSINLAHVPNDAKMLLAIRPAAVLEAPEIRKAFDEAVKSGPSPLRLMSLEGVEQITLIGLPGVDPDDWGKDAIAVVQFSRPTTFADLAKAGAFPEDATRVDGRLIVPASVPAYGVIDERTLALGVSGQLAKYVANRRKGSPAIASGAGFEKVQMGAVVAAVDMEVIREQFRQRAPGTAAAAPHESIAALSPLWTDTEYVLAGIIVEGKTVHLRAIATCHDGQLAENVADTVQAAVTLSRNTLRTVREQQRDIPAFAQFAMETADGLLKTVKVERQETLVVAQTKTEFPKEGADAASKLFGAISQARTSAQKASSSNNMKQIAIAMHNWADQHGGRFPPPVVMGKDGKGKVPHSWRVELLPYLEAQKLYDAYDFDEPWDSETNKLVLAQMHPIFRHPTDDPKSTSSAYYVLRSEKLLATTPAPGGGEFAPEGGFATAFSGRDGMSFAQIFDGTSNTIAVVEAKRDIPWTKPEDILFDPAKDPPMLGGFFKDGFNVGLCDGSVKFLDSKLDPKILKLLITPQDGQPVPSF